jgi:hypothetical protein
MHVTEGEYGRVERNIQNTLMVTGAALLRPNNIEKDKTDPVTLHRLNSQLLNQNEYIVPKINIVDTVHSNLRSKHKIRSSVYISNCMLDHRESPT